MFLVGTTDIVKNYEWLFIHASNDESGLTSKIATDHLGAGVPKNK